jgi:hypothetical protein
MPIYQRVTHGSNSFSGEFLVTKPISAKPFPPFFRRGVLRHRDAQLHPRHSKPVNRRCLNLIWLPKFGRRPRVRCEFLSPRTYADILFRRLGPVDLTIGTLSPDSDTSVPTVTDNLFSQGTIPADLFSVAFQPATETSVQNGELTFGDTDSSQFTGSITWA